MCSDIYIFCHYLVEIEVAVGWGSKFHEYKKVEKLFFFLYADDCYHSCCILEHLVDRNMQESCKNAPKMFKNLQYEILLEKLLGGTCILYTAFLPIVIYTL